MILGIYSFPKTGNTWMRHIVAQTLGGKSADIPDLHQSKFSAAVPLRGHLIYKSHSQRSVVPETEGFVHIRRHPLDVFLSYLNYLSANVTGLADIPYETVEQMPPDLFDYYFHAFAYGGNVKLVATGGNYFVNNAKWLERAHDGEAVRAIRYEDMLTDPEATVGPILKEWLGASDQDLQTGLAAAAEKTRKNGQFFWKKSAGNYLEYLTDKQLDLFRTLRGEETRALGYEI